MMKIELDIVEVTKAVSAYLSATFAVNVSVSDLKVVAGREANGARIEVSLETGSRAYVSTPCCGDVGLPTPSLEPIENDEDLAEEPDFAYTEPVAVEAPKAETAAPLAEQELKPVPGSFFASRKAEDN